jgi:hypothetical protein
MYIKAGKEAVEDRLSRVLGRELSVVDMGIC